MVCVPLGVTVPSQLRAMVRADPRPLAKEFSQRAPGCSRIPVQRWTVVRRLLLTAALLGAAVIAVVTAVQSPTRSRLQSVNRRPLSYLAATSGNPDRSTSTGAGLFGSRGRRGWRRRRGDLRGGFRPRPHPRLLTP